ncbi:hypothetical protein ACGFIJ_30000 [Microbispora bryophytorum]|uniref:hypothetical protein n=1 Tax=Microbispora bryophytorum TaxID=1460882 RepID=UPI0037222BA2
MGEPGEVAEVFAHRLALALVQLQELGDDAGARELVEQLSPAELRAVLLVQTGNVRQALPPWFVACGFAAVAGRRDRTAAEARVDYLGLRILRMAREEFGDAG